MDKYITIKELAARWEITPRRIQKMCAEGKLPGVVKFGRDWAIPYDIERPTDKRVVTGKYKGWRQKKDYVKDEA